MAKPKPPKESVEDILKKGDEVERVLRMPGWKNHIAPFIQQIIDGMEAKTRTIEIIGPHANNERIVREFVFYKASEKTARVILRDVNRWVEEKDAIRRAQEQSAHAGQQG